MRVTNKFVFGTIVVLLLSMISSFTVQSVSSCYPTTGICRTQAQGVHNVSNAGGSYWYPSVRTYTTNPPYSLDDIGYYSQEIHRAQLLNVSKLPCPPCPRAAALIGILP
jgi:hypothetical protein